MFLPGNYTETADERAERRRRPEPALARREEPVPASARPASRCRCGRGGMPQPPARRCRRRRRQGGNPPAAHQALEEKIAGLETEIESLETRSGEEALTLGPVAAHELSKQKLTKKRSSTCSSRSGPALGRGRPGRPDAVTAGGPRARPPDRRDRQRDAGTVAPGHEFPLALGAPRRDRHPGRAQVDRGRRPGPHPRGARPRGAGRALHFHDGRPRAHRGRRDCRGRGGLARRALQRNEPFLEKMRQRFARRGFEMPACNAKQADFIVGRACRESAGDGARFWGERGGTEIVILPGVPSEMKEIMESSVLPVLRERAAASRAPPHPAHRRDGGVGRRGARGARVREVEGRSRHDPGLAGRGPAAPVRGGAAAQGRGEARGDGVGLPRRSSATASSARTPRISRRSWAGSCGRAPRGGARGVVHGRDGVLAPDRRPGLERVLPRLGRLLRELRQGGAARGQR